MMVMIIIIMVFVMMIMAMTNIKMFLMVPEFFFPQTDVDGG